MIYAACGKHFIKLNIILQADGLHAVEAVSMKTVVTAGEEEQVRQCLEDMDLVSSLR